jgi:hypothetical protein
LSLLLPTGVSNDRDDAADDFLNGKVDNDLRDEILDVSVEKRIENKIIFVKTGRKRIHKCMYV